MADTENKWALNLDKIAYGVAGIVGVLVLLIPVLFSGEDRSGGLAAAVEDLVGRATRQKSELPRPTPLPLADIEKTQWTAGPALTNDPDWITEREQVTVKKLEKDPDQPAVHEAATLSELSVQRDPAKKVIYLEVKGVLSPKNEYIVVKKVEVLRKEEGAADFAVAGTAAVAAELAFRDEKVTPGKAYSYKFRTTAALDPKAPENVKFDAAQTVKESEALDSQPVPFEFSIANLTIDPQQEKFFAKLSYWDYKASKAIDAGMKEYKGKDTFADGRYEFFQIPPGEGKLIVRDTVSGAKYTITPQDSKKPRPVRLWDPITPGGGAKEDADAAPEEPATKDAGKAKAAPAAKAAPKAPEKAAPKAPEKKPEKKAAPKKGFK